MTHPDVRAALGRERQNTLLADAQAARTARQARLYRRQAATPARRGSPPQYRAGRGTQVVLRDGSAVVIRQAHSDAPLLADGFAKLSGVSRWMRFLRPKDELSLAELHCFTTVYHHGHEALGALDDRTGRLVGVARYIRHADDPQTADIAVTVAEAWQGRGLGTELLSQLADRAHAEGIQRLAALVADDHAAMAGLLRSMRAHLLRRHPASPSTRSACHRARTGRRRQRGPRRRAQPLGTASLGVTPAQADVPQSSPAGGLSMTWHDR